MADMKTVALRALGLLDLTSLNDGDTEDTVRALCQKGQTPHGNVAAVCVWPRFVAQAVAALKDTSIKVAAVANFPDGGSDIDQAVRTAEQIIESGGDEVDVVFPYRAFLRGDEATAKQLVSAVKRACGPDGRLKVILETGCLPDADAIKRASVIALENGADFIKTSTGKTEVSATPEAARVMLTAIRDSKSGAGFKPSGGIRSVSDAATYLDLADGIMGSNWVSADRFRFGASGLLNNILATLDGDAHAAPSTESY